MELPPAKQVAEIIKLSKQWAADHEARLPYYDLSDFKSFYCSPDYAYKRVFVEDMRQCMLEVSYLPYGSPPDTARSTKTMPLFVFIETCSYHSATELAQELGHIRERLAEAMPV